MNEIKSMCYYLESESTKDDDCFPGASDVDMRMDYHPESLLSNLGYSGNVCVQ